MSKPKKKTPGGKSKKRPPTTDLLEQYSPYNVAKILATSIKKKEDAFESLIPKDGTCLDYNVSQTFLRMDAGDTKISIKDTTATYVPVPPEMLEKAKQKPRGPKYSNGYPPQWVFAEEIWLQKQNELQEIYKKNLLEYIKRRKINEKLQGRRTHKRVQALVGPEWYQEMSPNQMRTADNLGSCIQKDLKDDTIINTQENIASLGLVLRPNHRHIAIALRLCCKCPVEFLLILYQLINPHRIQYSLNDRLLLSAVVHLTMRNTMREMHVRIPSPPKPVKVPVKPPKKLKQKTYISPYLKPYTFEPTPRKYTGDYENPRIQYPESPYFSYIDSLIIERIVADDVLELDDSNFEPEEQELIEDWRQAQLIYDSIQNEGTKIKLVKPSVVVGCPDFEEYYAELLAKLEEKDGSGAEGDSRRRSASMGQGSMGQGVGGTGDGPGGGKNRGRRRSGRNSIMEEDEGLNLPPLAKLEDDICGLDKCSCHPDAGICREHHSLKPCKACMERDASKECNCKRRAELLKKYKKKTHKIIGGVVITRSNTAVPIVSGIVPPKSCNWVEIITEAQSKCGYCSAIMDTIICSEHKSLQPCADCRRFSRACTCEDRSLLLKEYRRHTQKIIGGVMRMRNNTVVPIISGIVPPRSGDWIQALEDIERKCLYCEKIKDIEKCCEHQLPEPCEECMRQCMMACECRQKSKLYTTPKCKSCEMREYKKNTKKWIGGVMLTKSNTAIPIISGLVPPKVCDCVQEYKNKIIAVAARNKLQCLQINYVIGGITITKDGPVYILSAAMRKKKGKAKVPKRVCKTAKDKQEQKPKVKRELGPYDCTCGEESSDEEEEEEGKEEEELGEEEEQNEEGEEQKEKTPKAEPCLKIKKGNGDNNDDDDECVCKGKNKKEEKKTVCIRESKDDEEGESEDEDEEDDSKTCTCKKPKEEPQDFAFSQPCDCRDLCECKQATKLVTESKCLKCVEKQKLRMVERIIGGVQQVGKDLVPIVHGTLLQDSCECLQDYKNKIIGIAARNQIMNQKSKFVVVGVTTTKDGPVYILSSAMGKKTKKKRRRKESKDQGEQEECVCKKSPVRRRKESSDEEPDDAPFKYSCCRCKEELDRFLSHKCTCEECMEHENQKNATYIQGGVKYTESGNVIKILSGVYGQRCNCLEKYLEKIAALEDYRKRIEARYRLKSQNLKYAIGGVVNTPKGPVYVISGMRPPVECECARVLQEKLEEQQHQSQMAKMPPTGRIKYEISGIKQMSQENVFIVSQAMAIDDCDCMKLYNKFEEAHKSCLNTYDDFLKQAQEAIDEYNNEMAAGLRESTGEAQFGEDGEFDFPEETGDEPRTSINESMTPKETSADEDKESTDFDKYLREYPEESSTEEYTESESESSTWSSNPSIPAMQLKFTPSGRIDTSLEGEGIENGDGTEDKKKKDELNENQQLKRFIILRKIPCKEKKQVEIVKRVLQSLADDGFPLAKLPDCHKLPHFKLWMQMRCGMFWTQKDRIKYERCSRTIWGHTDFCHREVGRPQLDISKSKAKLLTWKDAAFIRQHVSEKIGMFYRLVKQENIENVREFFPPTFDYEFPTPTFRDCYFAYLATKEEEVLVYRIVKPHEARTNLKKFPCY